MGMDEHKPGLKEARDKGCYALWIRRQEGGRIKIGARGWMEFGAGDYVYVGRAAKGLRARIERHAKKEKRSFWHVDYLLADDKSKLVRCFVFPGDPGAECSIVGHLLNLPEAIVVAGFGNSDCRQKCPGHLARFVKEPKPALSYHLAGLDNQPNIVWPKGKA